MNSRIVYHGSSLPPGTRFIGIKKPTLERPFFVANDVEAAGEYAWVPARGGGKPSMFLVVLKKSPYDAFQFTDEGLDKLKTKLPKVSETLREYTRRKTFWDWSMEIQYWLEDSLKPSQDQPWDTEGLGKGVLEIMVELGLVTKTGEDNGSTCPVRLSPELLSVMRMSTWKPSSSKAKDPGLKDPTSVIRRLVKSRIYKAIKDLGYDMVMDGDTTGTHGLSKEIAILDTSAISFGWSVSVDPKNVENVAKEVDKMLSSKGKLQIGEVSERLKRLSRR